MNDSKNFLLAAFSSVPSFLTAIDTEKLIAIISAIILPIVFFAVGKTADIAVQIYFRRQEARRLKGKNNDEI